LDLLAVSKSFGFSVPPFVNLPVSHKSKVEENAKVTGGGFHKRPMKIGFKQKNSQRKKY